ncbi:MAG: DUF1592 domain-containing protein [Pseudomonadota bacterium]
MKTRHFFTLSSIALGLIVAEAGNTAPLADKQWAMIETYCSECHNQDDFSGGLAFELMEQDALHDDAETWEKVVRKLRGGMMPPPGQPRPESKELGNFLTTLETSLDDVAEQNPNPGAPLLHRMNRTEYANAVRDLLGIKVNPADLMPVDDSSAGFDNIANALGMSPALMQSYVTAAAKISRLAIGDVTTSPGVTSFQSVPGVSQASHIEGLALGTRGGISVDYVFPLDAEYQFDIRRFGNNGFALPAVGLRDPIEVVIDGVQVAVIPPDAPPKITLPVGAGPRTIQIAFLHQQPEQDVDDLYSVHASSASIGGFDITGPLNASGAGETPSRQRVFTCMPREVSEETRCAREILTNLASRAWRHPAAEESVDTLMNFFEDGKALRGFETGVQYALARILVDPQFVYRFEKEPEHLQVGDIYEVDAYELAARLSFFIWGSIPDDELLKLAESGELSKPGILQQQAARMMSDPRASSLVENFATQWLSLRVLDTINPTSPDYDGNLRESMKKETTLLFANILKEDRPIVELLDADYTFVDERLAKHYGIPNIKGSHFRKVDVKDPNRRGLLGHASILTLTSAPNRTSPVKRGQWVLENILGTPPPPPPPGVETNLDETAAVGDAPTTIRERLERHRADPSCNSCHGVIDPYGFALENFDEIGKWRDQIGLAPVDATSTLLDGTQMNGPQDMREVLLNKQENFVMTASEKLMTYALGRKVEYYDMPSLREIVRNAEDEDYTMSSLVSGIVASPAFRMRIKQAEESNTQVAQD